jgi:hypothetical protein
MNNTFKNEMPGDCDGKKYSYGLTITMLSEGWGVMGCAVSAMKAFP